MEVQLQSATADLKSAQKRIESLQGALLTAEGGGSDYEEDEDEEDSPSHLKTTAPARKKKLKDTYEDSSDGSYHVGELAGSSSDEELARIEARRKQREKERYDIKDDFDDIEKKYHKQKKSSISDDFDLHKKKRVSDEEEEKVGKDKHLDDSVDDVPKKKYNWRELLSDDDDEPVKPPTRKKFDISDDDEDGVEQFKKGRKKYDIDSDEEIGTRTSRTRSSHLSSDEDISKADKSRTNEERKKPWKSKYDISDESDQDKPIRKTLSKSKVDISSDEDYKPKRSYKKYLDNDSLDEATESKKKPDSARTRVKKSWETSSDEDSYKPRPRSTKVSSLLSDDDDDMPILKHAPKRSEKSPSARSEETSPSRRKENVKFDVDDNESYKASRKRRERRRSRLSNTGTSPEDSPKRSSLK